jgi:hypothetical protein
MIDISDAIFALNSSIKIIRGNVAYDEQDNEIAYDMTQAQTKLAELQAQATATEQAQATAKASALAKLAALGLTVDEVKALVK